MDLRFTGESILFDRSEVRTEQFSPVDKVIYWKHYIETRSGWNELIYLVRLNWNHKSGIDRPRWILSDIAEVSFVYSALVSENKFLGKWRKWTYAQFVNRNCIQ